MQVGRITIVTAALLTPAVQAHTKPPQVGDTCEITRISESTEQSDSQSSGTSYDKDTIVERVVGVRPDGLELEYDFPKEVTKEERAGTWQFPARVFRPNVGPPQLLNRAELEGRVDPWLKAAKWPRSVCGHWIFTWNAFRIDCDPQSAMGMIEPFDLRSPDVREGAAYKAPEARSPSRLMRKAAGPDGAIFTAEMEVDPDAVRRSEAETDVVTGEILRKPKTLDEALHERAKEAISGTISVTFNTDSTGDVRRRTTVTKVEIKKADGHAETRTVTETLERRLTSGAR